MPDEGQPRTRIDRGLRDGLGDVGLAFFNFPALSVVQRAAILPIAEGRNVLVCAATATGKTEAVIAPLVWRLRKQTNGGGRGPRLLAVAPTRALVADLRARLETPLAKLGCRCGAQTSDFAGADSEPEVLITTPESFDSMLVRRLRVEGGEPVGHLLANVAAVFMDEAHCFDSTARGDQLAFLLARLRKLRELAVAKGWTTNPEIQVCGASATVHEPQQLAERLLGIGAQAVVCPGNRPIDVLTVQGRWQRLESGLSAADLASTLPVGTSPARIGTLLWAALESGECRKALVFVPSRRQCDLLGRELRRYLQERRQIWVETHHGSLSREHRQRAEDGFHEQRDAVLVATNTLEVGVDIGDVDVVALVGAPPDTSGLLQRIGRGGRRSGLTRLLPSARNAVDAAALASQLVNATTGCIEPRHRFRRWDVFSQQVISYIRQNQGQGRSMDALKQLAAAAWPAADTAQLAEAHIRGWSADGYMAEHRGKFHLAGAWEHYAGHVDGDYTIHSNIPSSSRGREVRNVLTGEVVGSVAGPAENADTLTIAGRQHRVIREDQCIIVAPVNDAEADNREDTPQYGGRRRRVSESFAAHVRRGCGLSDNHAPLVRAKNLLLWFHFGGEVYEAVLRRLFPQFVDTSAIAGIALRIFPGFDAGIVSAVDAGRLNHFLAQEGMGLLNDEGLGRFAEHLSIAGIESMLRELRFADRFRNWLRTRFIPPAKPLAEHPNLAALLVVD